MMRRVVAIALGALLAGGCEEDEALPPPLPASAAPAPSLATSLRQRTRDYFAANEESRCVVYWQEGERRSVAKEIRCPREIEPGERVRLLGKTCMREAVVPDRDVPVRCPQEIFYVMQADHGHKRDDYKLAPKK